ncbi:MAG: BamA/TamA family outer membrane protein [Paracoccaceae bacterium]|nr:BamA/TamA family outer membrane protein [Paracoccaceae bacterium]
MQTRSFISVAILAALAPAVTGLHPAAARSFQAVEVQGNKLIAKDSILQACDINAGVDYDQDDLSAREECLQSSGMFKSVALHPADDTLVVAVEEVDMRPGHVEFSVAYDTQNKIVGSLYFERYNLFPDTFGSVELNAAEEMRSLRTGLYYSGLEDGKTGIGMDGLLRHTDYEDQGYASDRAQIEGYLAKDLGVAGRLEFGLGYRSLKMSDTSGGASALIASEAGASNAPYLRFGYKYSSADARKGPDAPGYSVALDQYFWGLNDDNTVSETRIDANARFALGADTSLLLGFQGGVVAGLGGDTTRAVDRFNLGGADFRGFAPRGIGPKDGGYFVGGNTYAVASAEVQRGIGTVFDTPVRAGVFANIGSLWSLDDTLGGTIDDSAKLRSSVGLSMTFDISGAPVSLYVAKAIDKETGDDTQSFGLSIAARF